MAAFDDIMKPPSVPISTDNSGGAFSDIMTPAAEPQASETEKRLTADNLRALLNTRQGFTERMTDNIVPGIKNVIGGATSAAGGLFGGEGTFGERWRAGVNAEKQFRDQNRETTAGPLGYAADAAGIIGSMGKPGGAFVPTKSGPLLSAKPVYADSLAAQQSAPTVTAAGRSATSLPKAALSGATQGVISGAAENSQDLEHAAQGGAVGGVVGGGMGALLHGLIGRLGANNAATAEREALRGPLPGEHFEDAGNMFRQLDNAGIQFDQAQARRMGGMLPQVLRDANYTPTAVPELADALRTVYSVGAQNAPPLTFTELQAVRGQISAAAQANPQNANLRRIAGRVTGMIDDFVANNVPAINRTGADLATLYPQARQLWRTGILGDTIQDAERIAANKAAGPGSSNADDLARKAMVQQANKDIKTGLPSLPPAADAARQRVIEGTPMQNALDSASGGAKDWAVTAGLGAAGGGALGHMLGLPPAVTTPLGGVLGMLGGRAASGVLKSAADARAANNMDALVRAIMTGSAAEPATHEMSRQMLARLLAQKGIERGGSQAAVNYGLNKGITQ